MLYSIGTMMWSTRFWWMLRSLGFDNVAVLDGGLDKWKAEGRPTETGDPKGYPAAVFKARPRPGMFADKHETNGRNQCSEHRHRERARPAIPSSGWSRAAMAVPVAYPAASMCRRRHSSIRQPRRFTTLADAAAKLAASGVTKDKKVICYCGGGISATVDLFLMHQLGYDDLTLYDGSMGEWAKDPQLPIETG